MCGEVFMEKVCARIKHGRKMCVASTYSKASKFFVQLVIPPKSTVGFVSNLHRFKFGRCKRFSPNFCIIGFAVRELHSWKQRVLQWSSWKDFHDKASGFLFQLVVPPKSTIGFVSNLNQSQFERCKKFSSNFSFIRVAVRELHLLEVEGVELSIFSSI